MDFLCLLCVFVLSILCAYNRVLAQRSKNQNLFVHRLFQKTETLVVKKPGAPSLRAVTGFEAIALAKRLLHWSSLYCHLFLPFLSLLPSNMVLAPRSQKLHQVSPNKRYLVALAPNISRGPNCKKRLQKKQLLWSKFC